MTSELDSIEKIWKSAHKELEQVSSPEELEQWRVNYIGRKGAVPMLLRGVKDLPEGERKKVGALANELRAELEKEYKKQELGIRNKELGTVEKEEKREKKIDELRVTDYGLRAKGHLHPLTLTIRRIQDIFCAMGFLMAEGPEIEEARYDFDLLNIPLEHPTRAETDTFYIKTQNELVLRTQTSPVQLRAVLENDLVPPFRVFSPGRVFRNEKPDPSHESVFHQTEGLSVGDDVSIADFKGTIETFYQVFFDKRVKTRLRPGYFPFVEPGIEFDVQCFLCDGGGCRVCERTGWLEMGGAGMVHPNVLRNMNLNPEKYQGFAFGFGVERLAMLQHGITDIRMFWAGDIRFLTQFS